MSNQDLRQAAEWVAEEVRKAGGRLTLRGSTILALFFADAFDATTSSRIAAALNAEGLHTEPALRAETRPEHEIVVAAGDPAVSSEAEPEPVPVVAEPAPVEPAAVLAAQATALPSAAITAGALVPGVLFATLGLVSYWMFGLLFLGLAGGVWLVARQARFGLARIFFVPLRSLWLSGFLLTAVPVLLASAVAGAVIVTPVASQRAADERRGEARALLAAADRSLRAGDLPGARRHLAAAREKEPHVRGHDELRQLIVHEEQRRQEEEERQRTYTDGRAAVDEDPAHAMAVLADLNGYRDSEALLARARRNLAADQLTRGRAAFRGGDFARARDSALESLRTRKTQAASQLLSDARGALALQRERARARARARAQARALERAAAQQRAADRRRQRQLEEAQEQQEAPPESAPSVPSGGTCADTPLRNFPVPPGDPRDGNNDGIACES